MRTNTTKEKVKGGGLAVGVIFGFPSETVVELCGYAGFDFIIIDGEHGPVNEESCERMVRAAEVVGITPLVRVAGNDPKLIARFLDTGALGVTVPHINTAEEAEAVVRAARYFPEGSRGLGPARAPDYAQVTSMGEYTKEANRQISVGIIIEDIAALPNLDDIVAVEGIDTISIGTRDLSTSMGFSGQYDHPQVRKAIDEIIEAVAASDKALGMPYRGTESTLGFIERGAQLVTVSIMPLITNAGRALIQELRGSARGEVR